MSIEDDVIVIIENNNPFYTDKEIVPSTTLYELEFDSLDMVELSMALEDEFDISIEDKDCNSWQTVSDVINFIKRHKT